MMFEMQLLFNQWKENVYLSTKRAIWTTYNYYTPSVPSPCEMTQLILSHILMHNFDLK